MKHYEQIVELGCFSRMQLTTLLGNSATADSMIQEYLRKGYIERVRRDLYAVISLETKQPILSRYGIGNALFPDAVISHHSAFEVYGYANQVYYTLFVATANRFSDFVYNGITYHRIQPKKDMTEAIVENICVTSIEQTVIDSIADFEKIGGLEETLRCIRLIPSLDEAKMVKLLTKRDNGFLWQKCGYVLSHLNAELHLSTVFFDICKNHKTGSKRPLMQNAPYLPIWDSEWRLYVPAEFRELIEKGVGSDVAI